VICRPSVPELGAFDLPTDEETVGRELIDWLDVLVLGARLVIALLGLLLGALLVIALLEMLLLGVRLVIALLEMLLLGARLVMAWLELLEEVDLGVAIGAGAGLEACRLC
jgi:hypothetical protein